MDDIINVRLFAESDEEHYQKLAELHANKFGHDFSIFVGDDEITAHKYLLLTRSGYFHKNIIPNSNSIQLEGVDPNHIRKLVEVIETNRAEILSSERDDFFHCLESFEVIGLKNDPDIKPEIPTTIPEKVEEQQELGLAEIQGTNRVICLRCPNKKEFSCMHAAKTHFKEQHLTNGQLFKCIICPKRFKSKRYLANHTKSLHKISVKQLKGNTIPKFKTKKEPKEE